MSIETLLAEHTAALKANTEALAGVTTAWNKLMARAAQIEASGNADNFAVAGTPLTEKAAAEKSGKGKPAATPAAPAPAPKEAAAPAPAADSPSDDSATRDDLLDLIKAKAKTHRDEVVKALGKYGAKKGSEVKDADIAACVADLKAVGAEVEEDLA